MPRHPIERYRHARGLRQADLAEKVGVSETTVRNWESGMGPQGPRIPRVAEALGVDPLALVDELDRWHAAANGTPKKRKRVDAPRVQAAS